MTRERKPCLRCLELFAPHHAHCKRCPPCVILHNAERQKQHDKTRPRDYRTAKPKPLPRVHYRADFLLALPELRAELKRQMGAMTMPALLPSDPLDLPSLSTQRGTGRQGYR